MIPAAACRRRVEVSHLLPVHVFFTNCKVKCRQHKLMILYYPCVIQFCICVFYRKRPVWPCPGGALCLCGEGQMSCRRQEEVESPTRAPHVADSAFPCRRYPLEKSATKRGAGDTFLSDYHPYFRQQEARFRREGPVSERGRLTENAP